MSNHWATFLQPRRLCRSSLVLRSKQRAVIAAKKALAQLDKISRELTTFKQLSSIIASEDFYQLSAKAYGHKYVPIGISKVEFRYCRVLRFASNSHGAPRGKKTNWYRDLHLPTGYPGLDCSVYFEFTQNVATRHPGRFNLMTDSIVAFGIHLGSGSFGDAHGQYSATIWAQHFPALYATQWASSVLSRQGCTADAGSEVQFV